MFMKITEVAQILGLFLQRFQLRLIEEKMGCAKFWAIFSQTHLVTLLKILVQVELPCGQKYRENTVLLIP
jgi:hypothetical protein